MRFRFSNNASALVTTTVTTTATTVILEAGSGAAFPGLSGGDLMRAALVSPTGVKEIVQVVDITGDTATVQRGQEGSAAQTFPSGSRFECRMTAGMAENFLQRTGDSMNGDLDMAGHQILNPVFPGVVRFVHINVQLIRPIDIDPTQIYNPDTETSSIVIPPQSSGQRPSYHNSSILNQKMFSGVVLDWFGDVNHVPPWFKLCNGTNNTPDLRGRYIKGWLDSFGPSAYGGHEVTRSDPADAFGVSWGLAMDSSGQHIHGMAAIDLNAGNLPSINLGVPERIDVQSGSGASVVRFLPGATYNSAETSLHSHQIFSDGVHNHWVHQPPFFVLAKVMFV